MAQRGRGRPWGAKSRDDGQKRYEVRMYEQEFVELKRLIQRSRLDLAKLSSRELRELAGEALGPNSTRRFETAVNELSAEQVQITPARLLRRIIAIRFKERNPNRRRPSDRTVERWVRPLSERRSSRRW